MNFDRITPIKKLSRLKPWTNSSVPNMLKNKTESHSFTFEVLFSEIFGLEDNSIFVTP